ncbi:MAG: hypothetical protein WCJ53_12990 [Mycobacteriaceae bacterium]
MTNRGAVAWVMAAVAAATLVSAPAASARPVCEDAGNQTICQTNGSISIKSRPGTTASPANQPQINWHIGRRRR